MVHYITPGYLQKQPCHLPEETGVQLLCAASYDIWCRDMDTDQTSTEQTCGRTDKNGKKYAQHHIQRQKDQHLGQGEDKSHRYNQHCKKNEMVLGRAYQPPQRRPMDLACHQLETIWQEKTTRETSQAMERRPGQILERHDMAEESTRQGSLETACWGLRPTTGHNGCLMMNDDDMNSCPVLFFRLSESQGWKG